MMNTLRLRIRIPIDNRTDGRPRVIQVTSYIIPCDNDITSLVDHKFLLVVQIPAKQQQQQQQQQIDVEDGVQPCDSDRGAYPTVLLGVRDECDS